MDSLLSFVRFARSECGLAAPRVLFGPFSPVIHGPDDVAERFPSLGGSVLAGTPVRASSLDSLAPGHWLEQVVSDQPIRAGPRFSWATE